ncbi:MAG TPA: S41 family peptidase [Rhizomicrobium sp.]
MNKRIPLTLAGAAFGFCIAGTFLHFAYGAQETPSPYSELDRFGQAFAKVRANYVEPPDDKLLVENAIGGMLTNLDAHSSYFDPKTFAEMTVKTEGEYGGVGIVIQSDKGTIKAVAIIDDAPAQKAGVKANDTILQIDGTPITGFKLDDVQKKMRGVSGTKVTLTVSRVGMKDPIDIKLVRAQVPVEPVTSKRQGSVGYIKVPAFNDHTDSGVQAAVAKLKKEIGPGIKGYIIDLRDDGGGVLDQAIAVSDDFLEGGEILSMRGRKPEDTERFDAHPGDITGGKPILVLVNGGTASASEIVAGALQDHKRARIVGMTSFGKGSVQTIIPLNNGEDGALHMTTARYYTPSGRTIQAEGIVPDVVVSQGPDANDPYAEFDQREANLPHHLEAEGPAPAPAAKPIMPPAGKKFDDFQLSYAVSLLQGGPVVADADTAPTKAGAKKKGAN